ncbi:winged helix-turn-helix transcriptional regulator [Pseudonocardia tropica]|uniref:winged helix-turn-helix transcriptional regulator n=1 Tax=Pseudonocardia tropica TaxID=681289 RepID=UPI003CD06864
MHELDRLGTKWTSMVVGSLADGGELRFTELRRRAPGISQKMLSTTLQNLVLDGLVARRVEDTVPPHVHYRLTELGTSLEVPLSALREWAQQNMGRIDDHRTRTEADRAARQVRTSLGRRATIGSPSRPEGPERVPDVEPPSGVEPRTRA